MHHQNESKENKTHKTKRFLIIDIDACLFTYRSSLPELLSDKLIEYAKQYNYDGFYICTHRRRNMYHEKNPQQDFIEKCFQDIFVYEADTCYFQIKNIKLDKKNFYTSQIIKNFSLKTGLPLIAVSTPDDFSDTAPKEPALRCGSGYKNIVEPYENQLLGISTSDHKSTQSPVPKKSMEIKFKNNQFIQIGEHVIANFEDVDEFKLDVIDDLDEICLEATKVQTNKLSNKITMNIYCHKNNGPIDFVGSVKGTKSHSSSPVDVINKMGLLSLKDEKSEAEVCSLKTDVVLVPP